MLIGQIAKRTGFAESQIRYWERRGLLPSPDRAESGYRSYDERDVRRLELLRRGKVLGLSLGEISGLLEAAERGCCGETAQASRSLAQRKIEKIDSRIAELRALRATLEEALAAGGPAADGCIEPCATDDRKEVNEMAEVTVLRLPETGEEQRESASGGCCEPECGPETCGTQAELPIEVLQVKQTAGGCCEPECGPETCG